MTSRAAAVAAATAAIVVDVAVTIQVAEVASVLAVSKINFSEVINEKAGLFIEVRLFLLLLRPAQRQDGL